MEQGFWEMQEAFAVLPDSGESAAELIKLLAEGGQTVSLAESCTGGLAAAALVSVPGASEVFENGFITYSDRAKNRILGVDRQVLQKYTAVSAQTAAWMARGCRRAGQADLAVSVTGLAGPGGGTEDKPVGLVYIGCCVGRPGGERTVVQEYHFRGDRGEVRRQAAAAAMALGLECLHKACEEDAREEVKDR